DLSSGSAAGSSIVAPVEVPHGPGRRTRRCRSIRPCGGLERRRRDRRPYWNSPGRCDIERVGLLDHGTHLRERALCGFQTSSEPNRWPDLLHCTVYLIARIYLFPKFQTLIRSEERRVGKECRS